MGLRDQLEDEVPPQRGESLCQILIFGRSALYALVRYPDQIWQRRAGQGERRGPGHGPWYVGDLLPLSAERR